MKRLDGTSIDRIDLEIFSLIYEEPSTTTRLANEIFTPKNKHELRKQDNFIRARVNRWTNQGFICKRQGKPNKYYIEEGKLLIGDGKLYIHEACIELGSLIILFGKAQFIVEAIDNIR